jgi:hypothetical protein
MRLSAPARPRDSSEPDGRSGNSEPLVEAASARPTFGAKAPTFTLKGA